MAPTKRRVWVWGPYTIWPKTPKMALISEYLAADTAADTSTNSSADALAIINIGKSKRKQVTAFLKHTPLLHPPFLNPFLKH